MYIFYIIIKMYFKLYLKLLWVFHCSILNRINQKQFKGIGGLKYYTRFKTKHPMLSTILCNGRYQRSLLPLPHTYDKYSYLYLYN